MAAAVGNIVITSYVFGGPSEEAAFTTETVGIPVPGAIFTELNANDPKVTAGCNSKITYLGDPTGRTFYTNETVAQLVAQANGNLSAS